MNVYLLNPKLTPLPSHPTFRHPPTEEARGRRVRLDLLLRVLLDDVPELPDKLGVENVKRLVWVSLPVPNVRSEQVVIRLLVPLRGKNNRGPRREKPGSARVAG